MAEYIDREAFVADKRAHYCDNCDRRKGMKNGKMRFVYDIGDAPCRSCGVDDMMGDIEDYPAADVVEVKHGQWSICEEYTSVSQTRRRETHVITWMCSECFASNGRRKTKYCPNCGAKMDKEAIE